MSSVSPIIFHKQKPTNAFFKENIELILKPVETCNFKCTFCSSTNITDEKTKVLDLQQVFDTLNRFNVNTVILNGGDPLMVKPNYYWKIIEHIEKNNLPTTLSFTTNLWAFYKKPEMWTELFKHPRVGVATSFNYGDTRRVTETQVYTEDLFWKVSNLFLDFIGYRPDFISVITEENDNTAIDNVRLAQKMNVECKLNYAMSSGRQIKPYQLSKIYATYIQIYEEGLAPWEYNTKQLLVRLQGKHTTCPQQRTCDEHIRVLQPSGDYYSCGAFADDMDKPISFIQEVLNGEKITPLQDDPNLQTLKVDCYSCSMFDICNGCRKTIKDMKQHNMVESHCSLMKRLAPKIIEITKAK